MVEPILLAAALAVGLAMVAWRLFRPRSIASFIGWLARGLMLLLLVAVLLRPGIPTSSQPIQSTQADVFLVVDTTASIAAEDWSGNSPRLNGIKADIRTVVEQFAGARFALITFDRTAVLRVPLTSDAASVITASEVLQVEVSGYSKGSSIGLAAGLLEDQLRVAAREEPERGRAAFYFGDGEQTAATTPESFSGSARYLGGGRVYGYGTEAGGPMLANEGPRKKKQDYIIDTATGVPALSHSDPARLVRLRLSSVCPWFGGTGRVL